VRRLYHRDVPLAFGGHFVFSRLFEGGWVAVAAAVVMVVLVLYWPRITDWIERRWGSR
jgi:K+ transporter